MEVIAKTGAGFLIQATEHEIMEVLNSVNGVKPKEVIIGQKIPAIDYAATILKIKSLKDNYDFRQLVAKAQQVSEAVKELEQAVVTAGTIQI